MSISLTGKNLNILISCDYTIIHNWMTFFCWYCLEKNLPDAKVFIVCNRTPLNSFLFAWTKRCKVPFEIVKKSSIESHVELAKKRGYEGSLLVISPDMAAIRDFGESDFDQNSLYGKTYFADENLCCDAKEEKPCVFARYSKGWGKFVTSSWINKSSSPFTKENRYALGDMTVNEVRIGRLWNLVSHLFQTVSRG